MLASVWSVLTGADLTKYSISGACGTLNLKFGEQKMERWASHILLLLFNKVLTLVNIARISICIIIIMNVIVILDMI